MLHLITHICDDIRFETGNKVSLMGLYDQAVVVKKLPARLSKLCFFQTWADSPGVTSVAVELRGEPVGAVFRIEGRVLREEEKTKTRLRLMLTFSPVELRAEGEVEFVTYCNESSKPEWTHRITVRLDRSDADTQ